MSGEQHMLKRTFVITVMALLIHTFPMVEASRANEDTIDYSQGDIKKALNDGKTVFVDYAAEWCGTCKRQERVIDKLRSENPAYNKVITFVRVDWDLFRSDEVTTSRNIPRRSTLLILKGKKELGRIVAGTSENDIKALMDLGLAN
jgi:thioredoxin 1